MTKDNLQPITSHERPIVSYKDRLVQLAQQKPIIWAPVSNLWGRQMPGEYSHKTEHFINKMYGSAYGFDWLLQHPVWLYACEDYVFDYNNKLIIIDGHHRARYAPKYGIVNIPSIIFFEPELVAITGQTDIGRVLSDEAANAIYEFSRFMPHEKCTHCFQTVDGDEFVHLTHADFKPPVPIK